MEVSIEIITPGQAEHYLKYNTNNRKLRKSLVDQYSGEMLSGRWRLTHQGIAFNCDGTLLGSNADAWKRVQVLWRALFVVVR